MQVSTVKDATIVERFYRTVIITVGDSALFLLEACSLYVTP